MIDIVVSIKDKEYPFFMKLVKNDDFVTVRGLLHVQPHDTIEGVQDTPEQTASQVVKSVPMSSQEFTNGIEQTEAMPSVTLHRAKTKWAKKR